MSVEDERLHADGTEHWARWVLGARFEAEATQGWEPVPFHQQVRQAVLSWASPQAGEVVLDVGAGDGLIGFGALAPVGNSGRVIFTDVAPELVEYCRRTAAARGCEDRCEFLVAGAEDLSAIPDSSVDVVTTRSVLIFVAAKDQALREFHRVLRPGGRLAMFEPINSFGQPEVETRFWGFDLSSIPEIARKLHDAHERYRLGPCASMTDFDERDILAGLERAGYAQHVMQLTTQVVSTPLLDSADWDTFLATAPNPLVPTFDVFLDEVLNADERQALEGHLRPLVEAKQGTRRQATAYFWARA